MPLFRFIGKNSWRKFLFSSVFFIFFLLSFRLFTQPRICFGLKCIRLELARTERQRAIGLMYRQALSEDRGMLFIFERDDFWGFWMKNTIIPLDILWLDKDKKIVDIVENAMPFDGDNPPTFKPVYKSRYVLEVNSGFVKKNNIKIGDRAQFYWIFTSKELE